MDNPSEQHTTAASELALHKELNELSRLYIRQSDFAHAEPVLERLLQIARAKGEGHPDVATALAGLAVAKRGLGDSASAEQLYRQALRIREEVLAPHHMAIVVTLEQLAETCADRGKHAEALVHLERALLRRERALGAEHATVHALRERIADVKRRHREWNTTGRTQPRPAGELAFLFRSEASAVRAAAPAPEPRPATEPSVAAIPTAAPAVAADPAPEPARTWSRRRTTRFASAGAALVVLASAGFGFSANGRSESELDVAPAAAERRSAVVTPASNAGSLAVAGASANEAQPIRSNATSAATDTHHAPEPEVRAAAMPGISVALPMLKRLIVPKIAAPSVDSLVRDAVKVARDADAEPVGETGSLLSAARNDDATMTPAVLIAAPTLRFPDELRAQRVEGEVVVQLRVNEKGRVDPSSMKVMHSDHELFTAAVRNALPRFRFEPARSAGPESKPQSATVQFRAQFKAPK